MKKLFIPLGSFLIALGCANKAPAPSLAASGCSLSNSAQCKPTAPTQPQQPVVTPFYESVAPSSLSESRPNLASDERRSEGDRVIEFDIPVVVNEDVERWISYFQSSGRKYYSNWLSRSGKYIPMMQNILKEHGLPQDLVYLSMIESGFKPVALSHAKAMGPWQFMKGTSRVYGLRTDWWIDERRDPEKSTIAAAEHLRDLYDQFNHWYLAAAGYNAGAGKITRAMQRYSTEDFWEMAQFRYLKPETKNYVPKLLAAAIIAKQPEAYGFTGIVYEEPIQYSKVHVPESVELKAVADALEVDAELLTDLNPALLRGVTPPDYPDYELKVPYGMDQKFLENYAKIKEASASAVLRHVVKRSETLGAIARRYGISVREIQSMNKMKSTRLHPGQELVIPSRGTPARRSPESTSKKRLPMPEASLKPYHEVRPGDTLWDISKKYNVSVSDLKSWNRMDRSNLVAGSRLRVQPAVAKQTTAHRGSTSWATVRVTRGDTLWSLAKKHGVTVDQLREWNDLSHNSPLFYGKRLKIRSGSL